MSKKTDKLKNILKANMILESRILNEQTGNNATPAKDASVKMVTTTASGEGLYPTGKASPNPKDAGFQKLVDVLADTLNNRSIPKPITVSVQGSASAVPFANDPNGVKNKKLADERGKQAIEFLKQNVDNAIQFKYPDPKQRDPKASDDNINYKLLPGVVGKATTKGPEANKEQSIIMTYPSVGTAAVPPTTAIDTSSTARVNIPGGGLQGGAPKKEVEKILKGMKSVVLRSSDGKTVYKLTQEQYNDISKVLAKYNMFIPLSVIKPVAGTSGI